MTSYCPLCGEKDYTAVYKTLLQYPGAAIIKCSNCEHIYTLLNHEPDNEKLYKDDVYKLVENRNSLFDRILNWEYSRVLKKIYSIKRSKGALLDFGCGKGKFGSIAKNKGWQVKAVETATERAEYAKTVYGLEVSTNFYTTGRIFNNDFDVLTLFHVLEHLPNPKVLLNELIKHNLAKDGLVVIEVPNFRSLQARIAGRRWMHFDVPRHISHFTAGKLEELGRELNLKTVKTSFFSFHLGVLGMTDSLLKLFGYRKNIIYELKNKKRVGLLFCIVLLMPFSLIFETCASATGHGGIIRKYFVWNSKEQNTALQQMKMKIGIMGTRGIPNNYGGFEQFAQFLAVGLVKKGYQVSVYNSHRHPYQEKEWNGVQIIHCKDWEQKMGTFGQFFYDLNCIRDARKRNFDVLFHFGYSSDSFWWRRWPKKTVNIVNMDGLEWKRTKYNWLTRNFLKWAESLAAKKANVLVADSLAIQQHILDKYNKTSNFIPYGAVIFATPDAGVLSKYQLKPSEYFMVIARMEPENNIEMILKGYQASKQSCPLLIIGNTANRFGKYISSRYHQSNIIFAGPVYNNEFLNNLRYHSQIYFHGHSVGGTNPSLLEAMACGCTIAAHDNVFNKAVLENEGYYFSTAEDVTAIINMPKEPYRAEQFRSLNIKKIRTIYNPEKILAAYGELILNVCHK